MLFTPTNLSPSNLSIDATLPNLFMWQNNGDAQTNYQLKIYKNSDSTLIYNSTKLTSADNFHTVPANSLTNNIEYKYQVSIWSSATITVNSEFVFIKTNSTPTVSMTVPATITTQSYQFIATYTQAENIPFQKWKMILYNNSNEILDNTDYIYDYNIKHTFEGLVASTTYKVECIAETQYGLIGTTGKISFSVAYSYPGSAGELNTQILNNIGGIKLTWNDLNLIEGTVTGTYEYVNGKFNKSLKLLDSSLLTFEKQIPLDFTINFWVKLESGFSGDIIILDDDFRIGWDSTLNRFYYVCQYRSVCGIQTTLPTDYFRIGIKHSKIVIVSSTTSYTEIIE